MNAQFLDPAFLQKAFFELPLKDIFLLSFSGFASLYFSWAAIGFFYGRVFCQRLGWGTILDKRPLFKGQLTYELRNSLMSILIFAFYGGLTAWALRRGYVTILFQPFSWGRFLLHMAVIVVWNELHFYTIHRMLHRKWWFKHVHEIHHRSVTTTPFSTYSFHPVEALFLSSVMILAMLFIDFDVYVVLVFPAVSLMMNTIGHLNFTVFSEAGMNQVASASRRHAAHHRFFNGNYGFLLPYLDRWCASAFSEKKDFR